MKEILEFIQTKNIYLSLVVIIVSIIIYMIIKVLLENYIKIKSKHKLNKKKLTCLRMLLSVCKYVILIIDILIILELNGVNITSLVAGLGIVSLIGGLAIQDALKDVIMGINIIIDDYFSVEDVITINGLTGKVVELNLKTTKIKDLTNNNLYVIANRNITEAINISNQFDINIPLGYDAKIDKIEKFIDELIEDVNKLEHVNSSEYKGIKEYGDSAIFYIVRVYAKPEYHIELNRRINNMIKRSCEKNKIEIPFMQIDIHNK